MVPEETTDLYQENEELKVQSSVRARARLLIRKRMTCKRATTLKFLLQEEIQKLAARIEFMKIVHMEMHNRHIKPKMGGYFSTHGHGHGHPSTGQSPIAKSSTASFILKVCI